MTDGVKISVPNFDYDSIVRNPLLNFSQKRDAETDEAIPNEYGNTKIIAKYNGLTFIVFFNKENKTKLLITGSLHKYFNKGVHNSNDFQYIDFLYVLNDLEHKFNLNIKSCILNNLEIGVNIIPPTKSRMILKGLLSHYNAQFGNDPTLGTDYYETQHNNFYIKIYDKAKQYREIIPIIGELLRIELKYVKMNDLIILLTKQDLINRKYITLEDLKSINIWKVFGELLVKKWNEILFYDYTISIKGLSNLQKNKLLQWQNIYYWEDFNKSQKSKQRSKLNEIVKNHSNQLQLQISNLIKDKLSFLIQKGLPFNQGIAEKKSYQLTDNGNGKGGPINSILNELKGSPKQKVVSSNKIEDFIPNYNDWINDPRPLPF